MLPFKQQGDSLHNNVLGGARVIVEAVSDGIERGSRTRPQAESVSVGTRSVQVFLIIHNKLNQNLNNGK